MEAPTRIAVAGATGRAGHHIVDVLTERGIDVVPMSRATGVDIITTEGLDAALEGVHCIIDAATGPGRDQAAATEFFTTAARNLHEAGHRAGVHRMVVISIIGTDQFPTGYTAAKAVHEQVLLAGPVPVHLLRAAQFHEFVGQLLEWGTQGDVSYVPKMRMQPVAARTVAEVVADLVNDENLPTGTFSEVAGPREEYLVDIAGRLVSQRGIPLTVEGVSDPDEPAHALYEAGALLPGPNAILAGPTFDEWLQSVPVAIS